ncbi:MAG: hypothetical protein IT428_16930 [Planctomycetaceae bacterium]|nr:hypothetical protein [Planctomycetaceae bacterium]
MPEYLAIHWDHHLAALQGNTARGSVRVTARYAGDWPADITPEQMPHKAGEWLKAELGKAGADAKQVILVLPRSAVLLKRAELPNAPDDELPDIVRFQAATASSAPLERQLLDFIPFPAIAESPTRSVIMATVFKDRVEAIRAVLAAAGRELTSVVVAPAAVAEWIAHLEQARGDDPAGTSLVVLYKDHRLNVGVLRDRRVVLAQSADFPEDDPPPTPQRLWAEVGRMLVPLEAHGGSGRINRAWCVGVSDEAMAVLSDRLECDVRTADLYAGGPISFPAGTTEDPVQFVSAAGALLGASGRTVEGIDFLDPRKPPVKRDLRKQRMAAAAACVAFVLGLGWWMLSARQADLDAQIENLRKEDVALTADNKAREPIVISANQLGEWHQRKVDWLEEYRKIQKLLPGTDSLYLTDLRAMPSTGDAVARFRATGYAKSRAQVSQFGERLAEAKYRNFPPDFRVSQRDPEYPTWFELYIDVLLPTPPPKSPAGKKT